jgi:glycerol-3-phosphate acyltransferase PlsX
MIVAVDAMGGDRAPGVIVEGALAASKLGVEVTLVGDEKRILAALAPHTSRTPVSVHHCEECIGMDEPPLRAVRQKKKASIRVAFDLLREGAADAVVSAGNSGATLAAGVLSLGRIQGVERPAIASIFPGEKGRVVVIDVGANVDCRPSHLFKFGIMGHAFARSCLGMKDPKIGLLSIGEEGSKGNEQVRQARELFERSRLNFCGNVEGRDLFTGDVQIIVCDGFVGNVALKLTEGMAEAMTRLLESELARSFRGRTAHLFGRRPLRRFKRKIDYEEYGGAPLLGINGVGIICHGGSSARAIKNAIGMASEYVKHRVVERLILQLKSLNEESVPAQA